MMEFDGSASQFDIASATFDPSSGWSIAGRMKAPSYVIATNPNQYMCSFNSAAGGANISIITQPSDHANADRQNKILLLSQTSAPANICQIVSGAVLMDDLLHTFLASYNPSAGTAHLYIDGVESLDTGNSGHVLTTGTIATGAGTKAFGYLPGGIRHYAGQVGYLGVFEGFIDFSLAANRALFFDANNQPVPPDESGWSQWGSQPFAWNEHGDMENNLGSAANFVRTDPILVGKGGN